MIDLGIGKTFEALIDWLKSNCGGLFDFTSGSITSMIEGFESVLLSVPWYVVAAIVALIAWRSAGRGVMLFSLIGLWLVNNMGFWEPTMETIALVFTSALIALVIGIPVGIWSSRNLLVEHAVRPILDLMQTMPAFVYLIPAVLFFKLGKVPGAVATIIFSMPPAVRFTHLGIKQVPADVVEAAKAFGSTSWQLLFKVQLPLAIRTIMAGVNQTIMLALSMVVIAAMIGAGGLGGQVLKGITQLKIGLGFESGLAVVVIAIILDRITQSFGQRKAVNRA